MTGGIHLFIYEIRVVMRKLRNNNETIRESNLVPTYLLRRNESVHYSGSWSSPFSNKMAADSDVSYSRNVSKMNFERVFGFEKRTVFSKRDHLFSLRSSSFILVNPIFLWGKIQDGELTNKCGI